MRNRIVPLSSIIQNPQVQEIQDQQIQDRVNDSNENHIDSSQQPQLNSKLTSLQKLNLFLEKMELEDDEEEKKILEKQGMIEEKQEQREGQNSNNQYQINVAKGPGESRINEQVVCKICLEDTNEPNNLLLTPCKCQGSIGNIHQECLKTWIVSQGYDLFAQIRCELCNEEYEMEIEIAQKCIPTKICAEQKYLQIFYLFWLVFFMIGNLVAMAFLIYYKISDEDSQWGYIIMALIILALFETSLVLLVKHYGNELFCGLYVRNWQILNFQEIPQNDLMDIEQNNNNNNLYPENELDRNDLTGMASHNIRRSVNNIRIIQSRSVLSNHIQDNNNNNQQNNEKVPSRLNHSRNQSHQGNENTKALNYSLGINKELKANYSNQSNLQKKSMTLSQMKAHLGLDDCDSQNKDSQAKFQENGNNDYNINFKTSTDQQLLNFLKNNNDLYSHVVRAYNRMDHQFMLNNNESSKDMTVVISVDRPEEQQPLNFKSGVQQIHKGASSKKIIHLYEQNEEEEEQKKDNQNSIQNNHYSNAVSPTYQVQIQNQNSLKKRSHHLIDIFRQEEISRQQEMQDQNERESSSSQNKTNSVVIQSQRVQIISPKKQNSNIQEE